MLCHTDTEEPQEADEKAPLNCELGRGKRIPGGTGIAHWEIVLKDITPS
jgi:hypothetical protein